MTQRSTLTERVTGAMFWNSLLLPVKTALTFISSIIVVRVLSQSEYAVFAAVIALLNTIGLWSDLGIENTIAKFIPEVEQRFGRGGLARFMGALLALKFALLSVVLGGLYLFSAQVSAYFNLEGGAYFGVITILLYLGTLSDFTLEFLLAYFHQKATNAMEISFALVQPLLVVLFVWFGWGVPGVLWARIVATLLYVALGFNFARRTFIQLRRAPEARGNWRDLRRRFVRLSSVAYFSGLTLYFSDLSFVVFVLTYYGDVLGVALFAVAFGRVLAPIRQFLVSSLWGVPIPMFARLYVQKDFVKLQEAYAALSRFLTLLLVPAGVGLALLAANLIRLFFQARYEPAASITIILVFFLFGESLFHPAQVVLVAFEENRTYFIGRVITLLAIPLLFLVAPTFSADGAAFAIGLVRLASRLYPTLQVERKFNLKFPFRFFFKVALASGLMALAMLLALGLERPHDVAEAAVRTALAFALGALTFLLAFKRLGSIETVDRERLAALKLPFKRVLLNWL